MQPFQLGVLVVISIFFSVLLANVAKIISTEAGFYPNHLNAREENVAQKDDYVKIIDDSPGELMWFLQV